MNPREVPPWPPVPPGRASASAQELFKARVAEAAQRRAAFDTANHESRVAVEAAQIAVLTSTIERGRDGAKTIQTASTAIAALYSGVVGVVFSVADKRPMPLRGVLPVMFLGAAIIFSTAFLAWFGSTGWTRGFPTSPSDATGLRTARVGWLNDWVSLGVLRKAWTLRLATLSLACGLVFLPAAFVPVHVARSALPDWPAVPVASTEMRTIRYTAEVAEMSQRRADVLARGAGTGGGWSVPEEAVWVAALLAAVGAGSLVAYQHTRGDLRTAILEVDLSAQPARRASRRS